MTQDKSVDHLLKPRYKVIADYYQGRRDVKDNAIKVGDIFMNSMPQQDVVWRRVTANEWDDQSIHNPQQYPHLFRKLEWYEERDFDLAGMCIRAGELNSRHAYYKLIEKIEHPLMELWRMQGKLREHEFPINGTYPVSESEYLTYINNKP